MKNFLIFVTGVTIGAGVSWIYHKNKYEEKVNEELREAREYKKQKAEDIESTDKLSEVEFQEEIKKTEDIIVENKYANKEDQENMAEKYKKPFVVTPEDFASVPGFDTDTFYYHANDIISNDNHDIVDDVEHILGLPILEIKGQFGVYEEDSVYIRNMRLKTDYEILREEENYIRRNGD